MAESNPTVALSGSARLIAPSRDVCTVHSSLDERCKGGAVFKLNVIHASAIGLGACALAALVVPTILLRGLGVPDASIEMHGVIRLSGVALLALASVLWSARFWLLS